MTLPIVPSNIPHFFILSLTPLIKSITLHTSLSPVTTEEVFLLLAGSASRSALGLIIPSCFHKDFISSVTRFSSCMKSSSISTIKK